MKLRLSTHTILLALPNNIGYHTYYSMDDFDVLIDVIPLDGEGNIHFIQMLDIRK
jgi:hypothetical protein